MKRRTKIILIAAVAIVPLSIVAFGGYYVFGESIVTGARVEEAAKKYQAAGLPWLAADLRPDPPVTPQENAAPLLQKAFDSHASKSLSNDVTAVREALKANDIPNAAKLLANHQKTLDFAVQASKKPRLDFNRDWDLGPDILFPEYAHVKAYGQLLAARAEVRQSQNNGQAALADLEAAFRLGPLFAQEPTLIALLVSIANQAIATDAVIRVAHIREARNQSLTPLIDLLKAHPAQADFDHALRGEAFMGVTVCRNLTGVNDLSKSINGQRSMPEESRLKRDGLPTSSYQKAFMTRHIEYWLEVEALSKTHADDPVAFTRALDAMNPFEQRGIKWMSQMLNAVIAPVYSQAGEAVVNCEANHRVHLAYLESLQYRRKNGKYSTDLTTLNPAFTDPFNNNQPLKTALVNGQFRVYSIGRNQTDEGGKATSEFPPDTNDELKKADTVAPRPRT